MELKVDTNALLEKIAEMTARKNAAYLERNKCVVALAKMAINMGYHAGVTQHDPNDKEWDDDWRTVLYIDLDVGQVSWHFHDSQKELLKDLPSYKGKGWDGHTTEEKYDRLSRLEIETYA